MLQGFSIANKFYPRPVSWGALTVGSPAAGHNLTDLLASFRRQQAGQRPEVEPYRGRARREGDGGRSETRIGWAVSGNARSFALVDRLATMTFPLAVRRPKDVVL